MPISFIVCLQISLFIFFITKSVFPSDAALEKMLYLASENVVRKWTQRYRNWDQVLNQLIVLYGERLTDYL